MMNDEMMKCSQFFFLGLVMVFHRILSQISIKPVPLKASHALISYTIKRGQ